MAIKTCIFRILSGLLAAFAVAFLSVATIGIKGGVAAHDTAAPDTPGNQPDIPACDTVSIPAAGPLVTCLSDRFAAEAAAWFTDNPEQKAYIKPSGDIFHVAYRGAGEAIGFCCDIQEALHFNSSHNVWHVSFAGKALHDLEIKVRLIIDGTVAIDPEWTNLTSWTGAEYVPLPDLKPGFGPNSLIKRGYTDPATGVFRNLYIHIPDQLEDGDPIDIVYIADGTGIPFMVGRLPGEEGGRIKRVYVGLPASGNRRTKENPYTRSDEYLFNPPRKRIDGFLAHEKFFLDMIVPDIENDLLGKYQINKSYLMGWSSGGAWALFTGVRNQHIFDGAYVFAPVYGPLVRFAEGAVLRPDFEIAVYHGSLVHREYDIGEGIICALRRKISAINFYVIPGGHASDVWTKAFLHSSLPEENATYVRKLSPNCDRE